MKHLRKLEKRDAVLMLEWMHDPEIAKNFRVDFRSMTLSDAEDFIAESFTETDQHFAVVDERDEYLGTISLKHIDKGNRNAEYAVATRSCAHGTGVALDATREVIDYAFETLGLHKIYLNVMKENGRANRFYEKCGFVFEGTTRDQIFSEGAFHDLNWYGIIRTE